MLAGLDTLGGDFESAHREIDSAAAEGPAALTVDGRTAEQVKNQLSRQTINVSTVALPPSAAPLVLDPAPEQQTVAVRASVHYYNTEDDLDRLITALP